MSKDLGMQAGEVVSGKEEERTPEELKARRAKLLNRIASAEVSAEGLADATLAKTDEKPSVDEFYVDTLQRFGITI